MPMSPRLLRPRQTIHPEAADWANRVRTHGGSVSGTTLSAVDRFVKAIVSAGIRDRFYRLNLFCGNSDANLAAVRTPLFRGPAYSADGLAGPELWTASTPLITDAGGSVGSWTAGTLTMTNTGTGSNTSYPRFRFSPSLTVGRSYTVVGRLDGDRTAVTQIRLDVAGNASNIAYNSTTGVFSATAIAGAAAIEFSLNATLGTKSVSIGALSIRESAWFGNATDTNNNFVAGDYAETGASSGLKGNGSTKFLDTGVNANALTANNSHMGFGLRATQTGGAAFRTLGGAFNGTNNAFEMSVRRNNTNLNCFFTRFAFPTDQAGEATLSASLGVGDVLMAYPSFYRNGAATGGTATTSANYTDAHAMYIFALNQANTSAISHTDARVNWYSIGLTMTSSQALAFYNAVASFNTALSRT